MLNQLQPYDPWSLERMKQQAYKDELDWEINHRNKQWQLDGMLYEQGKNDAQWQFR